MSDYVELLKRGGNEAIKINPPTGADFHITSRGSDWLFTVFCVNLLFGVILVPLMFRKPVKDRFVYYTAIAPNLFMSIAYFTMASNLGWIPVRAKYNHVQTSTQKEHPGYRQIFYARYVGWFLAFPWPIIQMSLLGGTPLWQIAFNVGMTEIFTVCWLIAACVHSTYKWGYYTIGIGAAIVVCISLMTTTFNLVKARGKDVSNVFVTFMSVIMFLWLIAYPTCFGITDGGNVLQPDSATIFYGIIDLLILSILPVLFMPLANYLGIERLGLIFDEEPAEHVGPVAEKKMPSPASFKSSDSDSSIKEKLKLKKKHKKDKKKAKKAKNAKKAKKAQEEEEDVATDSE